MGIKQRMLYIYLDESGDLGFDFVNKKPSRVFTIGILVVRGNDVRRKIVKMVERTLRKKLNPKGKRRRFVQELKGAATTLEVKKYFFRNIEEFDFDIYALTINKKRVYQSLIDDKARIYNWVARLLLDQIDYSAANMRVHLIIDKSKSKPELISKYRKADKTCKETFEIFKIAYAGFAKNMALDGLALGGVYIAGGIAPKNREIFDKSFVKIFEESLKMGHILKRMPIYLILNYDVGLLGAGFAGSRLL